MSVLKCHRLLGHDGSMKLLMDQWLKEVRRFEGDAAARYAEPYLSHAEAIANEAPAPRKYGVYSLSDADRSQHALFHANTAALPGTTGLTLRVNWVLMAPSYDYEDKTVTEVGRVVSGVLFNALEMCKNGLLQANHMKLHLSGVGDRRFAIALAEAMGIVQSAPAVEVRGNWLHFDNVR